MNNLTPRAKIGDVVIVRTITEQKVRQKQIYESWLEEDHWVYRITSDLYLYEDKDILKNLTTNTVYE